MTAPAKPRLLCTTALNGIQTDVYTLSGSASGWCYFNPEPTKHARPRLKIGTAHAEWWRCLSVLLHETQELVAIQFTLRFQQSDPYADDAAAFVFLMTHTEFSEVVSVSAHFLAVVVPKLAARWSKQHAPKKAKKGKK